jgi:hypothetical protein
MNRPLGIWGHSVVAMLVGCVMCVADPPPAFGEDCVPQPFAEQAKAKNIFVGRVLEVKTEIRAKKTRYAGWQIRVIKVLADGGLLAKAAKRGKSGDEVYVPASEWDEPTVSRFEKGQLLLFFFGDTINIECNDPIVIE